MAKRSKRWKVPNYVVYGILAALIVLVIVIVYFVFFRGNDSFSNQGITYKNYEKLEIGMKKEEVFKILGEDNCIISGYTTQDDISIVSYSCANSDGSNIQLVIKDNVLSEKTNFGFE